MKASITKKKEYGEVLWLREIGAYNYEKNRNSHSSYFP